jgi:amidohydrolase
MTKRSSSKILKAAHKFAPRITELRREFHQYPEVSFQEVRTSGRVAEELEKLGLEVQAKVGKTGVVGLLRGKGRKTVALRADMDALRIQEATGLAFSSRHEGVMHACGHDAHTAMLLGAAMVLASMRDKLKGNVKFIFQPAEENISGAKLMVKDGAMTKPKVDAVFGLHVKPELPVGTIAVSPGPAMSAADHFYIDVIGRGGHGALPHNACEPLPAAVSIYQALQMIRRDVDAFEPFVLSICSIHSGAAFNIIPNDAKLGGTLRTFSEKTRRLIKGRIRKILKGTEESFGVGCKVSYEVSTPMVNNDPACVALAEDSAARLKMDAIPSSCSTGSEDFSVFQAHAPGALCWLGVRRGTKPVSIHNDRFDIDERALPLGTAMLAELAVGWLAGK